MHTILVFGNVRSGRHSLIEALGLLDPARIKLEPASYGENNLTQQIMTIDKHQIKFMLATTYDCGPEGTTLTQLLTYPCDGAIYCIEPIHSHKHWLMVPFPSQVLQLQATLKAFAQAKRDLRKIPWLWVVTKQDQATVNGLEPIIQKIDTVGFSRQIACSITNPTSLRPIMEWLQQRIAPCHDPACISAPVLAEPDNHDLELGIDRNWSDHEILAAKLPVDWLVKRSCATTAQEFPFYLFVANSRQGLMAERDELLLLVLHSVEAIESHRHPIDQQHNPLLQHVPPAMIEVITVAIPMHIFQAIQASQSVAHVLLMLIVRMTQAIFFISLTDYLAKLILPQQQGQLPALNELAIHIPIANRVSSTNASFDQLRWYAQRPRFVVECQHWQEQWTRLTQLRDTALLNQARVFAEQNYAALAVMDKTIWKPLTKLASDFARIAQAAIPATAIDGSPPPDAADQDIWQSPWTTHPVTWADVNRYGFVMRCWRDAIDLAFTYEAVCRQWFLPTIFG
ncbi:GTPase domain-containing protein [Herpetosiphon sp. NSE202]|uniref:GTPase domain-containing protein n=1 Tax=Herpetosiphon sp. NSE202 TaxID=3351349 RepID=UPI00363AA3F1